MIRRTFRGNIYSHDNSTSKSFIENYFTHNMNLNGQQQKQYNEDINTIWDDIKDFTNYITYHQDKILLFQKMYLIQKIAQMIL